MLINKKGKDKNFDKVVAIVEKCNTLFSELSSSKIKPFSVPTNSSTKRMKNVNKYKEELRTNIFKRRTMEEEPKVDTSIRVLDFYQDLEQACINYTKGRVAYKNHTNQNNSISMDDFIYQYADDKINGKSLFLFWLNNIVRINNEQKEDLIFFYNELLDEGAERETLNSFWHFFNLLKIKTKEEKTKAYSCLLDVVDWAIKKGYTKMDRVLCSYLEYLSSINYDLPRIPEPNEKKEVFRDYHVYLKAKYAVYQPPKPKVIKQEVGYDDLFND